MSVHPACPGSHSGCLGAPPSPKSSSLSASGHSSSLKLRLKSDMSECRSDDPLLRSAGQIRDVNSTYIISACEKAGETPLTPNPAGRWALQRRAARNKEPLLVSELGDPTEKVTETHLRLQRRPRTGSMDKSKTAGSASVGTWKAAGSGSVGTWKAAQNMAGAARAMSTVGTVSHGKNSLFTSSAPSAGDLKDTRVRTDGKHRERFSALTGVRDSVALPSFSHPAPGGAQCQPTVRSGRLAATPTQSGSDGTVSGPGDSEGVAKTSRESAGLETRTPAKCAAGPNRTPRGVPRLPESSTPSVPVKRKPGSPRLANKREGPQECTRPPEPGAAAQDPSADRDALKVESSQVTVAVRVRPFSRRYVRPSW